MLFSKSSPVKKQDFLFMFLILVGIISVLFDNAPKKDKFQESIDFIVGVSDEKSLNTITRPLEAENTFAPGIAITLGSSTLTPNNDSPGCTTIRYVIRVFNTSTNNESLDGNSLVIDMGPDITVGPLVSGDTNNNNQIDVGEVWFYEAFKPITEADLLAETVLNQAHAETTVVGLGTTVSDDSHPSDINLDQPTTTKLSCRSGVDMILTGEPMANNGIDPGCNHITLTYEVHYTSTVPGETFESIVVYGMDGEQMIAPSEGDNAPMGVLDEGEIWIFKQEYIPTIEEAIAGQVVVQGYVEAISVMDANVLVSDLSDPVNLNEDNPTIIDYSLCPPIGLIKTATLVDLNSDGCNESIQYSFRVINTGVGDLEIVEVVDPLFGVDPLPGPIAGTDIGDDGILSIGEMWEYTATYEITQGDIDLGSVSNQASVTAFTTDTNEQVMDLSDDDSVSENETTITAVPNALCPPLMPDLGLIKTGVLADVDSDGCFESVRYTFRLNNTGFKDLETIEIVDPLLGPDPIPGPLPGFDVGNDGILSVGEIWGYEAIYEIQQADIDLGSVSNQATATGNVINTAEQAMDLSDDNSFTEDDFTITAVPNQICGPNIGLIKTSSLADLDLNGCNETIIYLFQVTNTGTKDLEIINIIDPLIGPNPIAGPLPGYDIDDDGILSTGEIWVYESSYTITQLDIDLGSVSNQATVTAFTTDTNEQIMDLSDNDSNSEDSQTDTLLPADQVCMPGLALIKTGTLIDLDSDGCDETIRYLFRVINTGDKDLEIIEVFDNLIGPDPILGPIPGSDIGDDGVLSPGELWGYEAFYDITQTDIDLGSVSNQATVTANVTDTNQQIMDLSDDNSATEDDQTITAVPNALCPPLVPSLGLIKTGVLADVDSDGCDESIRYTFRLTNNGFKDLENIEIIDPLLGPDPIPGPLPGFDVDNDGILSVGEIWGYEAIYEIQQVDIDLGSVSNQATATGNVINTAEQAMDLSDDNSFTEDDFTITAIPNQICEPSIELIKTGDPSVDVDFDNCYDGILYTFTVTNNGNVDLHTIVLTDDMVGPQVAQPLPGEDDGNDGILSIGEDWTYQATYTLLQADIDLGAVTNQADVSALSVGNNTPVADNQNIQTDLPAELCLPAGLALVKAGELMDLNEDGCDETIIYSFRVSNTGGIPIENVVLIDDLLGPNPIPGPIPGDDLGNDGILSGAETWHYEAYHAITQADIDLGSVTNQAIVTGDVIDSNDQVMDLSDDDVDWEDDQTITIVPNELCEPLVPGLALIKTGSLADLNSDGCDESIRYSFRVTNIGELHLELIELVDNLISPDPIAGPIAGTDINDDGILSIGETWDYEAIYEITQADIDFGSVTNQATVTGKVINSIQQAMDLSDNDNTQEDDPTNTAVPNELCSPLMPGLGLVKNGTLVDLDFDGCFESIRYTFRVTNTGDSDLETIELIDDLLGVDPIPGPMAGFDINEDGILSVGEVWNYEAFYEITQPDIDIGSVTNQATVTGTVVNSIEQATDLSDDDSPFEDNPTNTAVPNELCNPLGPEMALMKTGTLADLDSDGCDESIRYSFRVTNIGDFDLEFIELIDNKISPDPIAGPIAGTDINDDGILSKGETWSYETIYTITQADINIGSVTNQATITGTVVNSIEQAMDLSDDDSPFEDDPTNTVVPNELCNPDPFIQVIKQGTADVDEDSNGCIDGITYTFTVTNTGNVDLHTIVLTDDKINGQVLGPLANEDDNNDGVLSVGEDWVFQATYALVQADIDVGSVDNQADVTALSVGDDTPVNDSDAINTALPVNLCAPAPTIQVTKQGTADVDEDSDGCIDGITYTFTVTNTGNVDLHTIVLTDDKINGQVPGPLANEDEGNDGVLSVGEDWVFQATYALVQADIDLGSVDNQADVSALSVGDDTPVNDSGAINMALPVNLCAPAPAIQVIKQGTADVDEDSDGCIDGITYTFTVTNTGNVDLYTIVLNDDKIGGQVAGPLANEDDNNDGILSVGEDWVFQATYALVQADIDQGSVDNQADVTALSVGDDTPVNDSDNISTPLPVNLCAPAPAIQVIKQGTADVDEDSDGCIDGITYTFTVTNTGNVDLYTIVLNDDKIGGQVAGPLANEDDNNDGILSVGEDWVFQATYALVQADIDVGFVDNQADVTALSMGDDTPVNDSDNISTPLPVDLCDEVPVPSIGLIKIGSLVDLNMDGCVETILYSFSVINTGNVDLQSIELVDNQLGGVISGPINSSDDGNDGILSAGESWTFEAYKGISQIDIDMGSFNNQATVTAVTVGNDEEVTDFSDDNSTSEDDSTNTLIPIDACIDGGPSIGLIKLGVLADTDGDECPDGIRYIFTATNTGSVNLEQLVITDEKLLETKIIGPMESSDIDGDGILSVGESWTYEAIYTVTEKDTANGIVNNQANITATTVGMGIQVFDQSDDDSLLEDETTNTAIPEFLCDTDGSGPDNSEFKIYTGMTPNGDGVNDYFRISNIENYPNNVLKIFNRWGSLVYETENYGLSENLFRGISQGKATIAKDRTLPSGTYFYTLFFKGNNPGEESYSGYIYINRD